jgi:hypothetical protein
VTHEAAGGGYPHKLTNNSYMPPRTLRGAEPTTRVLTETYGGGGEQGCDDPQLPQRQGMQRACVWTGGRVETYRAHANRAPRPPTCTEELCDTITASGPAASVKASWEAKADTWYAPVPLMKPAPKEEDPAVTTLSTTCVNQRGQWMG